MHPEGTAVEDPRRWSTPKSDALEREVVGRLLDGVHLRVALDVGVGMGRLLPVPAGREGRIVAVEAVPERLRAAAARRPGPFDWVIADGRDLPVRLGSLTVVVLVRVRHLASDPRPLLREVRRDLHPQGAVLVS